MDSAVTQTTGKVVSKLQHYLDDLGRRLELRRLGIVTDSSLSHYQRHALHQFTRCLVEGTGLIVLDIGASIGEVSEALAKSPKVKSIVAFEPIPDSFESLSSRSTRYPKIRPINVALGSETGRTRFFKNESRGSSSLLKMHGSHIQHFPHTAGYEEIEVPVERLDDVVGALDLPTPDLIKIDVQGFEMQVLKGGESTFRAARWCSIELSFVQLYEDAPLFDELYRYMTALGFCLIEITEQLRGRDGVALQVNALFERSANPQ